MNSLTQSKKTTILPLLLAVALACFGLSPDARAKPGEDRGNGNSAAEHVSALNPGTTGSNNTAHGWFSLFSNIAGSDNTADGFQALYSNTNGFFNTTIGSGALSDNDSGSANTAVGFLALSHNVGGIENTAVGRGALNQNVFGQFNTAIGDGALFNNDSTGNALGRFNTAVGRFALGSNTDGAFNVGVGGGAGSGITSGDSNVAVGQGTGPNIGAGSNNTYIGAFVGPAFAESNTIRIADNTAFTPATQCFIGGIVGAPNFVDTVQINPATGQLGDQPSSARFKKDIGPMGNISEAIFSLKPVTFHYKNDKTNTPQFGLIAEEVAKVNPALIAVDKEGKPYTVAYDQINAMLLNEFLKAHRRMEEQEATISKQQKQIDALTAGLQKVSAQLELSKSAPQTVLNNQ